MTINATPNTILNVNTDTIFALSSGAGRAGVAVIRLSGPMAGATLCALLGRDTLPKARHAVYAPIRDPKTDERLDDAVAIYFAGPASFTGEDVVELHVHGGRAVIDGVLECLAVQPGLRIAEPGEYTRRAFENGKMDLTAAEGIADLIDCETAAQRRQAVRQMAGELGALYEDWRARLMKALAYIEADIDFPDEDLPGGIVPVVRGDLASVYAEIGKHLADNRRGERLREGFQIVILGAPNAGKSSLLNALAGKDSAIVTDIPGTTRDVLREHIHIDGMPLHIIDTAGLRESPDTVEQIGIERAWQEINDADKVLLMVDATAGDNINPNDIWPEFMEKLPKNMPLSIVRNKIDLVGEINTEMTEVNDIPVISISAQQQLGIEELKQHLKSAMGF